MRLIDADRFGAFCYDSVNDQSIGFRSLLKKQKDGGRVACRNGNLCRWYMTHRAPIHSLACPYECEFYIPVTAIIAERKEE